jgi:hypothetical protein
MTAFGKRGVSAAVMAARDEVTSGAGSAGFASPPSPFLFPIAARTCWPTQTAEIKWIGHFSNAFFSTGLRLFKETSPTTPLG